MFSTVWRKAAFWIAITWCFVVILYNGALLFSGRYGSHYQWQNDLLPWLMVGVLPLIACLLVLWIKPTKKEKH